MPATEGRDDVGSEQVRSTGGREFMEKVLLPRGSRHAVYIHLEPTSMNQKLKRLEA